MQIKPALEVTTPYISTKTDTIQKALHLMQLKIDSLEKIALKSEIGKEFFSDAISSNLYNFSTIVFFAGLIAWGCVYASLAVHKRQIKKETYKTIKDYELKFDKSIDELFFNSYNTNYDVNRAMYFYVNQNIDHDNALSWALSSAYAWVIKTPNDNGKFKQDDLGILNSWIDEAYSQTQFIKTGAPEVVNNTQNITFFLSELMLVDDDNTIQKVVELTTKVNHIIYSIPEIKEAEIVQ